MEGDKYESAKRYQEYTKAKEITNRYEKECRDIQKKRTNNSWYHEVSWINFKKDNPKEFLQSKLEYIKSDIAELDKKRELVNKHEGEDYLREYYTNERKRLVDELFKVRRFIKDMSELL